MTVLVATTSVDRIEEARHDRALLQPANRAAQYKSAGIFLRKLVFSQFQSFSSVDIAYLAGPPRLPHVSVFGNSFVPVFTSCTGGGIGFAGYSGLGSVPEVSIVPLRRYLIKGHSFRSSVYNGRSVPSVLFSKFRNDISLTLNSYSGGNTPIPLLFLFSRPMAVFGCVLSVVVDAVKRVRNGGFLSHIFRKIRKNIPSFTNSNSSTSISMVVMIVRVTTSAAHLYPSFVKRMTIFERHLNTPCERYKRNIMISNLTQAGG